MADPQKKLTLPDFLTANQIKEALDIWRRNRTPAQEIADKVISPNMTQINAKIGQPNDPLFLAYCCEAVFNETSTR